MMFFLIKKLNKKRLTFVNLFLLIFRLFHSYLFNVRFIFTIKVIITKDRIKRKVQYNN